MTRLLALFAWQLAGTAWLGAAASRRLTALLPSQAPVSGPSLSDMATAVVFVMAALAAVWLVACTVHDTAAAARGRRPVRLSPRWVRRLIDNAVGTALMVGLLAGPAAAATDPAIAPQAETSEPQGDVSLDVVDVSPDFTEPVEEEVPPASITVPVPVVPPTERPTAPPVDHAEAPEPEQLDESGPEDPEPQVGQPTHQVAAGENLWVIARAQLLNDSQPAPHDRDVHAYWVRLIAANVDGLRSGDPDLIFPGEVVVLPTADEVAP